MDNKRHTTITLEPQVYEYIDKKRGIAKRSSQINEIIKDAMERDEHESKL